eukprot:TRINITY_DN21577_c0_g1_i1.p1 TRINITY_DN21577_c0_g1~~TRINITY_DN21577_c0_g1_i1.p1  ORF type:complete len:309 (-),score=46.21 TRINITY_DN21577_c0_g1_i1:259-1185(-)
MQRRSRAPRPSEETGSSQQPGSAPGSAGSATRPWSLRAAARATLGRTGTALLGRTGAAVLGAEERGGPSDRSRRPSDPAKAFASSLPAGAGLPRAGSGGLGQGACATAAAAARQTPAPAAVPASTVPARQTPPQTSTTFGPAPKTKAEAPRPSKSKSAESPELPGALPEVETDREEAVAPEVVHRKTKGLTRRYSAVSQSAMCQLRDVEAQVAQVAGRVSELAGLCSEPEEQRVGLRTELATLEAQAHKLECQGVDNVYTSELESGKADAKDLKKMLLERLEQIFRNIEDCFEKLKASEASQPNTSVQ